MILDDCNLSTSNPIAASTKVSALNIVADLLKKLDVSSTRLNAQTVSFTQMTLVLELGGQAEGLENSETCITASD